MLDYETAVMNITLVEQTSHSNQASARLPALHTLLRSAVLLYSLCVPVSIKVQK